MKSFVVFSDIHGDTLSLLKLKNYTLECDGAFFAGDGINMLENFTKKEWRAVKGNCDFEGQREDFFEVDGVKIFLTHGDLYSVKSGYLRLLLRAKQLGADVVIFGHTHMPECFSEDGILFINPGTCSHYGFKKTYAVLFVSNGKPSAYINEIV